MQTALLLIAHGSRQAEANADLVHFAEVLRRQGPESIVEASFLESAPPDIQTGGATCVERGADRVVLVPWFLSAGVHVRRDLEEHRQRLAERFPGVVFLLAEPFGRHELLARIARERVAQMLDENH